MENDFYCVVLYCVLLYCIALHCIALHCIALYCIVLYLCHLCDYHITKSYKEIDIHIERNPWTDLLRPVFDYCIHVCQTRYE